MRHPFSIDSIGVDAPVAAYGDRLVRFDPESYEVVGALGIRRLFKGEEFYHVGRAIFLGQDCTGSMVSAINGVIVKVSYLMRSHSPTGWVTNRGLSYTHILKKLGEPSEKRSDGSDRHCVYIWDRDWGNVILEYNGPDVEIIITSKAIRNALPLGAGSGCLVHTVIMCVLTATVLGLTIALVVKA